MHKYEGMCDCLICRRTKEEDNLAFWLLIVIFIFIFVCL